MLPDVSGGVCNPGSDNPGQSHDVRDDAYDEHDENQDEIRQFLVSPISTNCYAYISEGECMVVDPGSSGDFIAEKLKDVELVLIVATHGHGDHVGGVFDLRAATGAPYLIAAADAERAQRININPELGITYDRNAPAPNRLIGEGDVLVVGTATFTVLETPGHTPGSLCLVGGGTARGIMFSGDTLFKGSCGRCDLEGGDYRAMQRSLRRLAAEIDPDTLVLSGHGEATMMERELRANPYLGM